MPSEVFISYASEDEWAAKRICSALEPEGLSCWMAPRDVPPGSDWVQSIMSAISESRLLLLVLSNASNASGHVLREVERGVHRNLPVLPVRIDGTEPDGNLAYFVSGSHWFDAPGADLDGRGALLVSAARELLTDPSRGWTRGRSAERDVTTRGARRLTVGASLLGAVVALVAAYLLLGPSGSDTPTLRSLGEGDETWSVRTDGPILSTPAVSGGSVLVGSDDQSIYAFRAATGQEQWRVSTGGPVRSSPAVAGGTVFIGSFDGNVYAIGADGGERWSTPTGFEVFSSPAVSADTVVIGAEGVLALDAGSGAEQWRFDTGGPVNSSPAISDGVAYAGSHDGFLYALDLETGGEIWRLKVSKPVNSSPTVSNGVVYVGGGRGLSAVAAESGERLWTLDVADGINSSPAVAAGAVYVGARDSYIYGLDAETGDELWRVAVGDRVDSSPSVASGVVYIGANDGAVYGLDAASGEQRWRFAAAAPIVASPVVSGGLVHVATDDGALYAVPAADG